MNAPLVPIGCKKNAQINLQPQDAIYETIKLSVDSNAVVHPCVFRPQPVSKNMVYIRIIGGK